MISPRADGRRETTPSTRAQIHSIVRRQEDRERAVPVLKLKGRAIDDSVKTSTGKPCMGVSGEPSYQINPYHVKRQDSNPGYDVILMKKEMPDIQRAKAYLEQLRRTRTISEDLFL